MVKHAIKSRASTMEFLMTYIHSIWKRNYGQDLSSIQILATVLGWLRLVQKAIFSSSGGQIIKNMRMLPSL